MDEPILTSEVKDNGVTVLTVRGKDILSDKDIQELQQQLSTALGEKTVQQPARIFLIDLKHVRYLHPAGFGELIKFLDKVSERGDQLRVVGAIQTIYEQFQIFRLLEKFKMKAPNETVEAAVAALTITPPPTDIDNPNAKPGMAIGEVSIA